MHICSDIVKCNAPKSFNVDSFIFYGVLLESMLALVIVMGIVSERDSICREDDVGLKAIRNLERSRRCCCHFLSWISNHAVRHC